MPGVSVLFWNLNARPLAPRVGRLVASLNADVVVLAECGYTAGAIAHAVSQAGEGLYQPVSGPGQKLRVLTRLSPAAVQLAVRAPGDRWLGFRVRVPQLPELLLYAAHLPSKLSTDAEGRGHAAKLLAEDILLSEVTEGHTRTLVVGDLNANPFEPPVAGVNGLHGVMTRALARRETRRVNGADCPMFYNPMWSYFGDRTPGPPGTYYRASSEGVNYFWSVYDQVLLRPAVMDRLTDLRVLDTDGIESLLTPGGRPNRTTGSDHLPIFFRLDW